MPEIASILDSAAFASRLPGSACMASRDESGAAVIVSTGCATMISSECPGKDSLAIGIPRDVQQVPDVVLICPRGNVGSFQNCQS